MTILDVSTATTISEAVKPGLRVLHEQHGDGRVVSVDTQVAKNGTVRTLASIQFHRTHDGWRAMLEGEPRNSSEDLLIKVPVDTLLNNPAWRSTTSNYADRTELLRDIAEYVGRTPSAHMGDAGGLTATQRAVKLLDSVSPMDIEACAAVIRTIADWVVAITVADTLKQPTDERVDTLERYVEQMGVDLWHKVLYPKLSTAVRSRLDTILAAVSVELAEDDREDSVQAAAYEVLDAIECRIHLVHHRSFNNALNESRHGSRSGVSR